MWLCGFLFGFNVDFNKKSNRILVCVFLILAILYLITELMFLKQTSKELKYLEEDMIRLKELEEIIMSTTKDIDKIIEKEQP